MTECTINCKGCICCLTEMLAEMHTDQSFLTLQLGGVYIDVERWNDTYSVYAHPSEYTDRPLADAVSILLAYVNGE